MMILALALAATVSAAETRKALQCADAESIRGFKAAVVEDRGWKPELAEELARCGCPREADAAGWGEPKPVAPKNFSFGYPGLKTADRKADTARLVKYFILYEKKPLPVDREGAERVAGCWFDRIKADQDAFIRSGKPAVAPAPSVKPAKTR